MSESQVINVSLKCVNGDVLAGIGHPTRINSLIGISHFSDYQKELTKLEALNAMENGPDIVADLSNIRDLPDKPIWQRIIEETPFVAATVPIYLAHSKKGKIDAKELLDLATKQMESGVGLLTIHLTPTRELVELANKRLTPCTSRGGGLVICDIMARQQSSQNVYFEILDELLLVAKRTGTVISLGTTFRPANIFDSLDDVQIHEINLQTKLAEHFQAVGVGVIVEGPGHCRPSDIKRVACLLRQARTPIMTLGPIPLDSAIEMDHIAGAIGATLLGLEDCAVFLAAITREEHTGNLPSLQSIVEAVNSVRIASKIIDLHLLNEDKREHEVATLRAASRSCVAGKTSPACSRCAADCPLINTIQMN